MSLLLFGESIAPDGHSYKCTFLVKGNLKLIYGRQAISFPRGLFDWIFAKTWCVCWKTISAIIERIYFKEVTCKNVGTALQG